MMYNAKIRRCSSVGSQQQFCKLQVGGSNPSIGSRHWCNSSSSVFQTECAGAEPACRSKSSVGPSERSQDPSCEGRTPPLVYVARKGISGATGERQTRGETASTDGLIGFLKRGRNTHRIVSWRMCGAVGG